MSTQRNTDIEALRAAAVMGVFVHHMQTNLFTSPISAVDGFFKHFSFWFGVDLFFAISGFVIGRQLLPELLACTGDRKQQLSVTLAFWLRRAWRLLPSAWLWLGVIMLASLLFNHSGVFRSWQANLAATFAGIFDYANLRFAHAFMRFDYGASFVYWSLSLEEQFYFVLPLLIMLLRRRINVLLVVLALIQIPFARTPLLSTFRTDALALGVLLAIGSQKNVYTTLEPRWLLRLGPIRCAVPIFIFLVMAYLASPRLDHLRWHVGAIAVMSAVLVWLASYGMGYLGIPTWLQRTSLWIGARSYAIYLIHIPVFYALREACFRRGDVIASHGVAAALWLTAAISITFCLAELNYRWIEQPLRRHGKYLADKLLARHRAPQPAPVLEQTSESAHERYRQELG